MLKLFKKELKLNTNPVLWYLFPLFGTMVFIPNYAYIVASGYVALQIFYYLMFANQNLSMQFTSMLPTKRSDTVYAVSLMFVFAEVMNLAVMAICLYPAMLVHPDGNLAGMDANLTLLAVSTLGLGLFNLVTLPKYFKTGYKIGVPILCGLAAFLAIYIVCEVLVQAVPAVNAIFEGYSAETLWARIVLLAVSLVCFAVCTIVGAKIAVKKFEKVSL